MDFDSVIEKRHSVRSFSSKRVSWKLVMEAVYAATQAPFAGNENHVRFVITENTDNIKEIGQKSSQAWIQDATILAIVCTDEAKLKRLFDDHGEKYAQQQLGAYLENFLLKITDLGLGACWVGEFNERIVRRLYKIPESQKIEAIIPIGYIKTKPKEVRKRGLEQSIFWERWGTKRKPVPVKDPQAHREPWE